MSGARLDLTKQSRWRTTASTWVAKAVALLRHNAQAGPDARVIAGYDAARLLSDLLAAAEELAAVVNEDEDWQLDQLRREAQDVVRALRHRALAPKLAQTQGRTPEEAAAFESKARRLSGESD